MRIVGSSSRALTSVNLEGHKRVQFSVSVSHTSIEGRNYAEARGSVPPLQQLSHAAFRNR
eukprot:203208-Rhodomonas_salina.2